MSFNNYNWNPTKWENEIIANMVILSFILIIEIMKLNASYLFFANNIV